MRSSETGLRQNASTSYPKVKTRLYRIIMEIQHRNEALYYFVEMVISIMVNIGKFQCYCLTTLGNRMLWKKKGRISECRVQVISAKCFSQEPISLLAALRKVM